MNKILLLGSTGMLGFALMDGFLNSQKYDVIGTFKDNKKYIKLPSYFQKKLIKLSNIKNQNIIKNLILDIEPDIVINCIGVIKQNSKSNLADMIYINSYFPHLLSKFSSELNFKLLHFSTDCVFSGLSGPYSEYNQPDPIDNYGITKLLGEPNSKNTLIIRTSILGHEINSNISLIDWFLSQKGSVNGFTNAIFSGFPVTEISNIVTNNLIPYFKPGIFHLGNTPISKYEILKMIKEIYFKDIEIIKETTTIINRSLISNTFKLEFNHINKSTWPVMIKKLRDYYVKNKKTFQK